MHRHCWRLDATAKADSGSSAVKIVLSAETSEELDSWFAAMAGFAVLAAVSLSLDSDAGLKTVFDALDTNHDGLVSAADLREALHQVGHASSETATVESDFSRVGEDSIDFSAFCSTMRVHWIAGRDAMSATSKVETKEMSCSSPLGRLLQSKKVESVKEREQAGSSSPMARMLAAKSGAPAPQTDPNLGKDEDDHDVDDRTEVLLEQARAESETRVQTQYKQIECTFDLLRVHYLGSLILRLTRKEEELVVEPEDGEEDSTTATADDALTKESTASGPMAAMLKSKPEGDVSIKSVVATVRKVKGLDDMARLNELEIVRLHRMLLKEAQRRELELCHAQLSQLGDNASEALVAETTRLRDMINPASGPGAAEGAGTRWVSLREHVGKRNRFFSIAQLGVTMLSRTQKACDQADAALSSTEREVSNCIDAAERPLMVFDDVDQDGSGELDRDEITELAKSLAMDMTEDELDDAFVAMDKDCGGTISIDEFYGWWKKNEEQGESSELFSKLSKDTGVLDDAVVEYLVRPPP